MDFLKLSEERYSVRQFTDEQIPQDIIDKILRAAQIAPTGCNYQPQRILVINSPEAIEKLKECTKCHFGANCAMLVCYNENECWTRKYDGETSGVYDASIVTTHMMLEAASLGIGTTWVMHFNPFAMREQFNIPENLKPAALLVMGYPAPDSKPLNLHSETKEINEFVSYNKF